MFSKRLKLPKELADTVRSSLASTDTRRPAMELADGSWLLLAFAGPTIVREGEAVKVADWHELQHAVWEATSKTLIIRWVNPAREPWHAKTAEEDVHRFMSHFEEFINHTIVNAASRRADNGTWVTASIRRTAEGTLFSTLTADGPLDDAGQALADELEANLLESVGLDSSFGE